MKLSELRDLREADQRIYLLGRITAEATRMDAALRLLHAALRGERDLDALLDAPDVFRQNIESCRKMLGQDPGLETHVREAIGRSLTRAEGAYTQRNRYIHDLLRSDLFDRSWELAPLSRKKRESVEAQPVSFDEMVHLVLELTACTWRLRGAGMHLFNGGWTGLALGAVTGTWDGGADYQQ